MPEAWKDIVLASLVAEWTRRLVTHPMDTMAARLQYERRTGGVSAYPFVDDIKAVHLMVRHSLAQLISRVSQQGQSAYLHAKVASLRMTSGSSSNLSQHSPKAVLNAAASSAPRSISAASTLYCKPLYSGLVVSLMGAVPLAIVYMPTYEICKQVIATMPAVSNGEWGTVKLPQSQIASVATGVVCSCVRVPVSIIKARLQVGVSNSAFEAVRSASARGLRGLYVGWPAACFLDVSYAVIQFTTLERFRALGTRLSGGRQLSAVEDGLVGFLTGAVTAVATEPIDVVRLRLQTQQPGSSRNADFGYTGLVDGVRKVVRHEGLWALWRGLLPRLLVKSCGSCVWYAAYQWTRRQASARSQTC